MKKFIITIARGYGSGGKTMAKMLAKKLNVQYYDRELIRLASENTGINEAIFNLVDETHKKVLFKKYENQEIMPPDSEDFLSRENLFNMQAEIIRRLAEREESCIIVGRCADHVLKDNENTVRVFIYADMQQCVERIMDHDGVDAKEAERLITKIDKNRATYHKYFTGKEWNDARNYDLCINTSSMSFEQCAEMIIEYMKIKRVEN